MRYQVFRTFAGLLVAIGATFVLAATARADVRYINISGNDGNACTLAAPCRTLQRGINVTATNGELRVLGSGGYGTSATITRSITISGDGHTVTLTVPITINSATATVVLRDLQLDGLGSTARGIDISAAAAVHIEHCTVQRFSSDGIAATGTNVELFMVDSVARENGGTGLDVISSGAIKVAIDNSRFKKNTNHGVVLSGNGVYGAITRSVFAGNGSYGVELDNQAVATVARSMAAHNQIGYASFNKGNLDLESVQVHDNSTGVYSSSTSVVRVSNSTITQNTLGLMTNYGGAIYSRGNNTVANTTNVQGTLSAYSPM